jgi:hypothetical protein
MLVLTMSHIVSRQAWASIDINTETGLIFVEESWHYTWESLDSSHPHWSIEEKRAFHKAVDEQVWKRWSNRVRLHVTGKNEFAKRFSTAGVKVNFDTKWVLAAGNWRVRAVKVAPRDSVFRREAVDYSNRTILLYSSGLKAYTAQNDAGKTKAGFLANPHEFGHTMRNPDEYLRSGPHLIDGESIMNIGHELRDRHLKLLIDAINLMLPECSFQPWIQ